MEGTCRNLNPALREKIPEQMKRIITGIVEGMGGTIKVKSEVGKYTCFTITFLK